jgi:hypothetical protein
MEPQAFGDQVVAAALAAIILLKEPVEMQKLMDQVVAVAQTQSAIPVTPELAAQALS